jgi:CheY-like chemotaxis protein
MASGPEQQPAGRQPQKALAIRPWRVLVVDDNHDAADMMRIVLELDGHEVRIVHDGPAALELTKTFRPELILLDIGLPGMDGYKVAGSLRAMPESKNTVLVAVTGYSSEADVRHSREAGFDRHLSKPLRRKVLQKLIADADSG